MNSSGEEGDEQLAEDSRWLSVVEHMKADVYAAFDNRRNSFDLFGFDEYIGGSLSVLKGATLHNNRSVINLSQQTYKSYLELKITEDDEIKNVQAPQRTPRVPEATAGEEESI